MNLRTATQKDFPTVLAFYSRVIDAVDPAIRLGWAHGVYPDAPFLQAALDSGTLLLFTDTDAILGAAVVDHHANPAYEAAPWGVSTATEQTAIIHALAVAPERQGEGLAKEFLRQIVAWCRQRGDVTIRLDVLTRNKPAAALYESMDFAQVSEVAMFYDAVGEENFWLYEYVL